ncbi:MAG: hypothetical protein J6334_03570 [Kiritimatiellae bacterium]|nr:hypothetical protein [Kiritimatiellia bacterium]
MTAMGAAPAQGSGFKQVRHDRPVPFFRTVDSVEALAAFDAALRRRLPGEVWDYIVEPVFDGIPVALRYEAGRLVRAVTGGDGEIGEDVTAACPLVGELPRLLPDVPPLVELDGVVTLTREAFRRANRREEETGRGAFAALGHACLTLLRAAVPQSLADGAERTISPYGPLPQADLPVFVVERCVKMAEERFPAHAERVARLQRWGFKTAPWRRLCIDLPMVNEAINEVSAFRGGFPFAVRGAVVRMSRRDLADRLGTVGGFSQEGVVVACPAASAETRLRGITVRVARTGILVPVAEIEPVSLSGETVLRAVFPNMAVWDRSGFGVGDRVRIVNVGDALPLLTERLEGTGRPVPPPQRCPVCGEAVTRRDGETALRCENLACPARCAGLVRQLVSANGLDIPLMDEPLIQALIDRGWVREPLDLFALTPGRLAELEREGVPVGGGVLRGEPKKVLDALDAARRLPLHRWLYAAGIPGLGVADAERIAALHPSFSALAGSTVFARLARLETLAARTDAWEGQGDETVPEGERQASFNRLCGEIGVLGDELAAAGAVARIPGTALPPRYAFSVKSQTAKAVGAFFASAYGQRFAARLAALGIDPKRRETVGDAGHLKEVTFVLNGNFSVPRETYQRRIVAAGGWVQDAVVPGTCYLVAGNGTDATKTRKARALGGEVIDEAGLLALLLGNAVPVTPRPQPRETGNRRPPRKREKRAEGFHQDELF